MVFAATDRSNLVEPEHLVVRAASRLAHHGGFDYRVGGADPLIKCTRALGVDLGQATGVPGAAHLAPRRSAPASLKAVHPHQVGQEFRQPLRCEPQKASLDDFHHRNYGNPWAYLFLWVAPMVFGLFAAARHGRVEADQVFHVLESSDGSHRHDGPGGPSRLVPRRIFQNRHFYLAQGQTLLRHGQSAHCWISSPAAACSFAHGSDGQKGMGLIMLILTHRHGADGLCAEPRGDNERYRRICTRRQTKPTR